MRRVRACGIKVVYGTHVGGADGGTATGASMGGHARLVLERDGYRALLEVVDAGGRGAYRSELAVRRAAPDEHPPPVAVTLAALEELADGELVAAGWVSDGAWAALPGTDPPPGAQVDVAARPRVPLTASDQRALDALARLTTMARGPVTAAALVPHVAPRWQAAAALLRRLVASGQARAVGRTVGRVQRTLYAPVGTEWAPEDVPGR